jgi:hypothetical protein
MIRRIWIARLVVASLAAAAIVTPASAGLLPVSVTIQPEAGNFRWTYSVVLPTDMKLQAGNSFTIYDFDGYISGSGKVLSPYPDDSAAAYWTFSTSKTGPTPPLLSPTDDPNIDNLTWTYNGPTVPAGKVTLGNFVATSKYSESKDSFFTATNPRAADGVIDSNITNTITPTGQDTPPPPPVPEPTALALVGLGLPLVGIRRWLRRRD